MFKQEFLSQFPNELPVFLINQPKKIISLNLINAIEYLKNNNLNYENFYLNNKLMTSSVLVNKIILNLFSYGDSTYQENKKFINDLYSLNEEDLFKNIDNSKIIYVENSKQDIYKVVENLPKNIRKDEIKNLLKDSIFDKDSLISQIYNNPKKYFTELLPTLSNIYEDFYIKAKKENNKELFDQEFIKTQLDNKIMGDIMAAFIFSNSLV